MATIERFAIIGIETNSDGGARSGPYLAKPIGICERLSGDAHDIRIAFVEPGFGLCEAVYATTADDWRLKTRCADRLSQRVYCHSIAPERALFIRVVLRHALVAAAAGVRIRSLADLRLARVIEFTAT